MTIASTIAEKRPCRAPCEYRGWAIEGFGGFCTIRTWWAEKGGLAFWNEPFRALLDEIDALEDGAKTFDEIHAIHKRSLYNC